MKLRPALLRNQWCFIKVQYRKCNFVVNMHLTGHFPVVGEELNMPKDLE